MLHRQHSYTKGRWHSRCLYLFIIAVFLVQVLIFTSTIFNDIPCENSSRSTIPDIEAFILNETEPLIAVSHDDIQHKKEEVKDKRRRIDRPYMDTVANSMLTSIKDIDKVYPVSDECSKWGGVKYMDNLIASSRQLIIPTSTINTNSDNSTTSTFNSSSSSSVEYLSNDKMHLFHAQNVSLTIEMRSNFTTEDHAQPMFTLGVEGRLLKSLPTINKGKSVLEGMKSKSYNVQSDCEGHYIPYPVILVDSNLDSWNWWFFLQAILHYYIAIAALQPHIMGHYEQEAPRFLFASHDKMYSRSNLDLFDMLFSDGRGKDSTQVWTVEDYTDDKQWDSNNKQQLCFRRLIYAPSFGGGSLLVNKRHKYDSCFSSIIYSYAAYLKAGLHIPTLPRPKKPRVVWVGRDQSSTANRSSWQRQRVIDNQPQLVEFLTKKCLELGIELVVADFYGQKKETPIQEQALFISRANIMIGIHGAGLNMFHFMPFNSVVIEIHKGTTANKNSKNFVTNIKEGHYLTTSVSTGVKTLDQNAIWKLLNQGIDKWISLGITESDEN